MPSRYHTKGYLKIGPCRPNRFGGGNAASPFSQQGRVVSPCRWMRLPGNPNTHFQVAFAATKEQKTARPNPLSGLPENPRKARYSALVKHFALAAGKINVGKCKFVLACRRSAYYICRTKSPFVQGKADAVFIWIPPAFFCQRRNYFLLQQRRLAGSRLAMVGRGATQHFSGSLYAGIEKHSK